MVLIEINDEDYNYCSEIDLPRRLLLNNAVQYYPYDVLYTCRR